MVMADVYVADRAEAVRAQALAMALDLSVGKRLFDQDREQFRQRFTVVAANRGLAVAQIIDGDLTVIEKADSKVDLPVQLPSRETLASLQDDEPQVKLFPGRQLRRRHHQTAELREFLSVHRQSAGSARRRATFEAPG